MLNGLIYSESNLLKVPAGPFMIIRNCSFGIDGESSIYGRKLWCSVTLGLVTALLLKLLFGSNCRKQSHGIGAFSINIEHPFGDRAGSVPISWQVVMCIAIPLSLTVQRPVSFFLRDFGTKLTGGVALFTSVFSVTFSGVSCFPGRI